MKTRYLTVVASAMLVVSLPGCDMVASSARELPIETSFAFANFSKTMYAQLELQIPGDAAYSARRHRTPLLAPGTTYRRRFLDALDEPCPKRLDLRVWLFARVNSDVPIGLDQGETVAAAPVAAGEVLDIPVCVGPVVETYTVVNWDSPPGTARVKLAQATPVEDLIRSLGLFANPDAVWEFEGVAPSLADAAPQPLADVESIVGRVINAAGAGLADVGVLLRSRFRVRLADDDPSNDPDAGFGDPIDFVITDAEGGFRFDRPAGAYRVEAFSDEFAFRPGGVDVESPVETLLIVAEPIKSQ